MGGSNQEKHIAIEIAIIWPKTFLDEYPLQAAQNRSTGLTHVTEENVSQFLSIGLIAILPKSD